MIAKIVSEIVTETHLSDSMISILRKSHGPAFTNENLHSMFKIVKN